MKLIDYFIENEKACKEWADNLNEETPDHLTNCSGQTTPDGQTTRKRGCPTGKKQKLIPGETDLQTVFPKVALMWDYLKNNGLTPRDVSFGSRMKAWWICDKGHSWQAKIYSVANTVTGCPYCAGTKAIPGVTDLVTLFPEIAKQFDYEKNDELDPRTVSAFSHEKIWWKCELGHSWQAVPYSRTRTNGSGCPYCTGRKVLAGFNDLATLKPGLAEEWYQPLNGDLKPSDVSLGTNKKVYWCCADHHVWQASIYARTKKNGTGCPVCAGVAKARKINYFIDPQKGKTNYSPTGSDFSLRRFG